MQIHQLKPKTKNKERKRIGRGGKRGTYSGKGIKGQKSRAGRTTHPIIRDLIKKFPKLRGYRFNGKPEDFAIVNLGQLDKYFKESEVISPNSLIEKRLIRRINGKVPKVKILGKGELTKKLTIENCELSKGAKEEIEKTGGTIKSKVQKKDVPEKIIPQLDREGKPNKNDQIEQN